MSAHTNRLNVRRVRADEWRAYRDIRCAALRDAPTAFGERLASAEQRTDQEWRERTALGAEGVEQVLLVAERRGDTSFVGLTGCRLTEAGDADIISVWVSPSERGAGIARQLLDQALAWAASRGAVHAHLCVTEDNDTAARLYRAAGFVPTGEYSPHRSAPELRDVHMALDLTPH